jgi:hypothetical protein
MSNPLSVARQADPASGAQPSAAEGWAFLPSLSVRDALWLMVVGAFAAILLVSVGVECVFVFVFPGAQSPQALLILFTAASGFLGGLFAPSPFGTTHTHDAPANTSVAGGYLSPEG